MYVHVAYVAKDVRFIESIVVEKHSLGAEAICVIRDQVRFREFHFHCIRLTVIETYFAFI